MSQCKKFAPNIFNKTKCSNCFRQKEEHSAVALECNRASRTSARSGYLFLAPDWDFSVPLNRTKRWQRRWFVLYDDGELSYSVDEHPDTIPQGTVDMSQVLEVTSAEQLTGHPHSLALTAPDRVTFVKAASREDARWWLELLAVFPRRHKRNATFPGGRASPSLPHLGRSASPQPPRPLRHHGGGDVGGSPRTNFTTPPLKEERDRNTPASANSLISLSSSSALSSSNIQNVTLTTSGSSSSVGSNTSPRCSLVGVILKGDAQATAAAKVVGLGVDMVDHQQVGRPQWVPESSAVMCIDASGGGGGARDALLANPRTEYLISSGSPPTRDKLRCEDKARARRDWRHERLRDIATALTDRSPESSLTLPAEGLLHLKKGWLWHREAASSDSCDEWRRRWWVLCGPSLLGYRDQDEETGCAPLVSVELATVTGYSELRTDTRFGFQVLWSGGPPLNLCAVTMGIRSNWLQALRKAAPGIIESPSPMDAPPATTTSSNSSVPSSTSSSRHSTASSSQLTAVITAQQTPAQSTHGVIITHESGIRLRGDTLNNGVSCRLSTGSSSGGATPTTPKSGTMFSSDEEYRTASEGGRRDSMTDVDWVDSAGGGGGSMVKNLLNRSKDQRIERSRPQRLPRCQSSRQSTLDSNISSPDELDAASLPYADRVQCQPITAMDDTRPTSPAARMYYRHSVADMRTRKLHLQLQLDEEEAEKRRKRADGELALEKELVAARGDVRALEEDAQRLRGLLGEAASKELKSRDAVYDLEKIERDLTLKLEKLLREQKSLNRRLSESDEAIRESDERSATINRELQAKQRIVASLQDELTCANERCAASRLENDRLYKKLQELNTHNPPTATITPPPHPTTTTISHLTNIDLDSPLTSLSSTALTHHCLDLRMRFERTVAEIRELQHRLREAHAQIDVLQLDRLRFGQRVDAARAEYEGRVGMLKERVDDLTAKLLQVERAKSRGGGGGVRGQSTASGSGKVGRRSLSLRGRESFSLNKEVEDKVALLEAKLLSLENPNSASAVDRGRSTRRGKYSSSSGRRSTDNGSPIDDRSLRRLRRKSLDGATASEPMKLLMRLNALEEKVSGGGRRTSIESLNGVSASDGGAAVEKVDDSEMEALSLAREKYLQCVTTLGTAPGNIPVVLDGHMRELGRILRVPDDSLAINSDVDLVTASAQSLVGQLERALRRHYTELHERRSRLRERGELDYRAKVELLAEKIAFEDVIIGRIAEVLPSTNKLATTFLARETLETHHLIHHLRAKLNPSTTHTHSTHLHTSIQHLTQRFARQLLANALISHRQQQPVASPRRGEEVRACADRIDATGWRLLLGEQSRVHEMLDSYQRVRLVELADRLAADTVTLAADRSCSLVEEVGGRVWDEARRRVSAELIQSEVRHVLMKTAQQYEDLNSSDHTAGYSFTTFAMQRSKIEQWTDSIEEHLLARMEHFIAHLTATYHNSLHRMSTTNPPEQPIPNSSTSLLHEYADIIAHVALVDARIATLQSTSAISSGKSAVSGGIAGGTDETVGLRALLEASGGTSFGDINEVSVAEFKATLEVAVLCADRCVANISAGMEGGGRAAVDVSCAKCREGRNIAAVGGGSVDIYGDVCNGSFNWIGTSFNSYDSLSDQTPPPLQKLTSVSPTFPFSPSPPTTTTTYHHQIALLRDAFQQTLATYSDTSTDNQPSTREHQRHLHLVESSVERLRVVCEQVLVAMERVHRAAVQRMRANHQLEIDAVRRDKEQALAEETHATLAALDAMRKAHEAEVVKEVARFKQDLARQQAAELLELRERLSVKCLEVAALQEQLGSATRQLAHAHQHILHLEQQRAPTAS